MNHRRTKTIFFFVLLIWRAAAAQAEFTPQIGDLLFQDLDCGDFCDAVEAVTKGAKGYDFSHMALVDHDPKRGWIVYEARSKGVVKSSYDEFLQRSLDAKGHPKILVARLKSKWQPLIPQAIMWIKKRLGKLYDEVFDLQNDRYYCSEMIHLAFQAANQNAGLFKVEPMSFADPKTQQIFPVWQQYFAELGVPVPEGSPGLNPGGMSRSPKLKIVHNMMKP